MDRGAGKLHLWTVVFAVTWVAGMILPVLDASKKSAMLSIFMPALSVVGLVGVISALARLPELRENAGKRRRWALYLVCCAGVQIACLVPVYLGFIGIGPGTALIGAATALLVGGWLLLRHGI